ncbi:11582_t:CDS:2 [Ambispora gerdemannii]|uniref:11582_t:CDS:1 n=1 Tax=Ambispora gerdemannii TaxID=144530 RepID=A0A9N9B1B8_9GLOM|nr:11582_t:CDS:2 [Ambispora gerdemannii]
MKVFVQPALCSTTLVYRPKSLIVTTWILDVPMRPNKLTVQLWTNLTSSHSSHWISIEFKELNDGKASKIIGCDVKENYRTFKAVVFTNHINEGYYEFTVRFKREGDNEWQWVSKNTNQNGKLFVTNITQKVERGNKLINSIFCQKMGDQHVNYNLQDNIDCWCVSSDAKFNNGQPTSVNIGNLQNVVRFIALRRLNAWWIEPITGTGKLDIQDMDVYYILIQQSTSYYVVLIPLASDGCTSSFRTDKDGNLQLSTINDSGSTATAKFIVGFGQDPYIVSRACMKLIKILLGTLGKSEENKDKKEEQFYYDHLGYCTWNAFYKNVRGQDIMDTLKSLDSVGVHVGYVILDDGWQQVNQIDQLKSFEPDPKKFPEGLKGLISKVKGKFPYLKHFGVWHTLWGYWYGVDPSSELSSIYKVERVKKNDGRPTCLIAAQDIQKFYDDFYNYLRDQGVSLVKVDSQGNFDLICYGEIKHRKWWQEYQMLSGPGSEDLGGISRPLFRNSDDYFPDDENSHVWHIYANTMNNIWTTMMYSLPDWDMFQTNHKFGEFHAAARAISGGPMYITDHPNDHNIEVLAKCLINIPTYNSNISTPVISAPKQTKLSTKLLQKILRSQSSALPSLSTLFQDSTKVDNLLKIFNTNKRIGIIGLWNCRNHVLMDQVCIEDDYGQIFGSEDPDAKYAMYFFQNRKACLVNFDEKIPIIVQPAAFEIVTLSSIDVATGQKSPEGKFNIMVACFGLIDKYNGSRAVHSAEFISEKDYYSKIGLSKAKDQKSRVIYKVELIGYGEIGFYLDGPVSEIKACLGIRVLNDERVKYDSESKLLMVRMGLKDMEEDGFRNEIDRANGDILMVKLFLELVIC